MKGGISIIERRSRELINQAEIHRKIRSSEIGERLQAAEQLYGNFAVLPDKKQAWNDLIRLMEDEDSAVRSAATHILREVFLDVPDKKQAWDDLIRLTEDEYGSLLGAAFPYVPDKEQAWDDLHRLTEDEDSNVRQRAAGSLGAAFPCIPDKEQAWDDLHRLTEDEDSNVRQRAVGSLGAAFPLVLDKKQAWNDLHRLTKDEYSYVRSEAAGSLGVVFPLVPNKEQAWDDLHRLTEDEDIRVREKATYSLGAAFPLVPNKEQAWEDFHRLTEDEDISVRGGAAFSLGAAFPLIPDKNQAWNDLIRLMEDDFSVGVGAAHSLEVAFPLVPDKNQAWNDLIQLMEDGIFYLPEEGGVLGAAFPLVPDKEQAWDDLHRLTEDEDISVRGGVAFSLGAAFPLVPNKKQAWDDLHRLTEDEYIPVREEAADSLGAAFPLVPNKKQAWDDLIRLTEDKDLTVWINWRAGSALGAAFPHVPDKEQAWNDLYRLTKDDDDYLRRVAGSALGAAFPYIPDKKQAWDNLLWLTEDENSTVRASAKHSLGRASIFKAIETGSIEDFRYELENALVFFENSSMEGTYYNPADFCRLFYRSFYMLTFKQPAEAEVQNYLAEAKSAAEGWENKENLLETVENLAHALREAQKVSERGLDTIKCDLNAYRRYCERAAELVQKTKEKAPGATKMLERGFPIIDKRIKELLGEIEAKAEKFCVDSGRTPIEKIGRSSYGYTKGLGEVEYPIEAEARLNRLSPLLRSICTILPEESRKAICSQLDEIEETDLNYKVIIIESALSSINVQMNNLQEQLAERDRWIEYLKELVLKRLDNINYGVFKLKLRSGEIVPTLREIQTELNRLKTIQTDLKNLGLSLTELRDVQHHDLRTLNDEISRLAGEIETRIIPQLPETSDAQRVIEELHDLKQSKGEVWFNRAAALSSLIGLVLTIL
jgi:HEAT repeat protein